MPAQPHNVLFLCNHNAARSIMAEALLNHLAADDGRFRAFSAGIRSGEGVHPMALKVLEAEGIATEGLASKQWQVFTRLDAPRIDMLITVCDETAGEPCPVWPGHAITAHWGIEDPSLAQGCEIERERAFVTVLHYLRNRIKVLLALPVASLDRLALTQQVREIGEREGASARR